MASGAVSVPPQMKYEVFVNFRGEDTRDNFTSHLKEALHRNGINAFTDSELEAGEEISPALARKITESLVSIVVFSPNYADSWWCLDELVRIMECKKSHRQRVLPVFVQGVEPTHVRNLIGAFGEGYERLIQDTRYAAKWRCLGRKASWERALKQAADLTGHVTGQMSEVEIVNKLINRVQSVLSKMSPVDLDKRFIVMKHVEIVESSMFAFEQQWRCLGLWGMGGSGKTTLAKEIRKRISNHFEGSCFVEKVGELAERGKLERVYKKEMSQLLKMNDAHQDSDAIKRKLRVTKVLIVLDDVSDADQCQKLIEDWSLYHSGSKMIAISRDKQVLKNIDCDPIYEVTALDDHESLQLLKHHILKQREPTPDQVVLLKDAIKYTGGLPLALVVLGRNLFDKDITIWKSELVKLGDKPDLHITKILRTSFDGLDNDEKNIFLDIACLMKGWKKDRVVSILDACGFHAIRGIDRLVDKALLTISDHTISDDRIQMHDLLQQMGKDIGCDTRLCREKEIADLLTKRSQGRKMERRIEVISMEKSHDKTMKLGPGVFEEMRMLRILRFENLYNFHFERSKPISFVQGLKYLPDGLRYLEWTQYPEQSLPPRFNPVNLVELRMEESNLRQLWVDEMEPCLPSLKHADLSFSEKLTKVPNFRNSLKLETLGLSYCENLEEIPDISHLTKLVELDLECCSEFRILRQLPPSLIKLNLFGTEIKKLENTSIQGLSQLEHLAMTYCEELESLPNNIHVLKNHRELDLKGCRELLTLPSLQMPIIIQGGSSPSENPSAVRDGLRSLRMLYFPGFEGETLPCLKSLVSLEELILCHSNVKSLPEDIKYLTNLWKIDVSGSKSLSCIPELPPSLLYLDASYCTSLQKYAPLSQFDTKEFHSEKNLQMGFVNCISLEKVARSAIWRDLRLRIQSIFRGCDEYPELCACTPGNEGPDWFKYSNTGTWIQVNINRLHPIGFYFFVVLGAPTNYDISIWSLKVTCKGYNSDSRKTFDSSCNYDFNFHKEFQSKHTMVWYHHLGWDNDQFYLNGATFCFFVTTNGRPKNSCFILKCGVTPFYNNDDVDEDDNDDDDDNDRDDYNNNKGRRRRGSPSSILLAEEEPGDASGLDLNFPPPPEEGQGACGFDQNLSAPIEDDLDLEVRLAPPAEERASLVDRSQKRKRGHDQEEELGSHKRNS